MLAVTLRSPSSRRAWIEIVTNLNVSQLFASPSSRRAWIEILCRWSRSFTAAVALLAEGVDRNALIGVFCIKDNRRPPRGGRG